MTPPPITLAATERSYALMAALYQLAGRTYSATERLAWLVRMIKAEGGSSGGRA